MAMVSRRDDFHPLQQQVGDLLPQVVLNAAGAFIGEERIVTVRHG